MRIRGWVRGHRIEIALYSFVLMVFVAIAILAVTSTAGFGDALGGVA